MIRMFTTAAIVALSSTVAWAQTGGTAQEAKAMLVKAVAAVKADKAKAVEMFNAGTAASSIAISMCSAPI